MNNPLETIKTKRATVLTMLALGGLGVGLSGCDIGTQNETHSTPREITKISPNGAKFSWSDDYANDVHARSLECAGDTLLYETDVNFGFDKNKTYDGDAACEDGALSSQEITDFILSQEINFQPK